MLGADGKAVVVPVSQFRLDEAGDRMAQTVGTGKAKGPGLYLRAQDVLNNSEGTLVAGGIQFAF